MSNQETDDIVLELLLTAAEDGAPCPSNKAIGRHIYASDYVASRSLRRLELAGRIALIHGPSRGRRKVSIRGVGETDWTACEQGGNTKTAHLDRDGMERLSDDNDPWIGNCFAPHEVRIRNAKSV